MASNTCTVKNRLYFQVESKWTNSPFRSLNHMRGTFGSDCPFRDRNLVLILMTPYARNDFSRLSGQPTTHQLNGGSVFIYRLDWNRSIGRNLENNRTIFLYRNRSQITLDIPSTLNAMPVVVGNCFQISIFIRMQTNFFYGSARDIAQSFAFINILNKHSGFFFI